MAKLKVSTKYRMAQEKISRIIKLIKDHEEGITPKSIAFFTHININTVKSIIRQLEIKGIIMSKANLRGYYVLVENSTHILQFKLQNIILSFHSEAINVSNTIRETNSLNELIKFRFIIGKSSKKATLHVSTDYPFEPTSLTILAHLFQEKLRKYCDISVTLKDIIVTTFEINQDHLLYKLEGVNCITIDSIIAQYKLYQKQLCVREEFKIKVPVTFDLINQILQQGLISSELFIRTRQNEKIISRIDDKLRFIMNHLRMKEMGH